MSVGPFPVDVIYAPRKLYCKLIEQRKSYDVIVWGSCPLAYIFCLVTGISGLWFTQISPKFDGCIQYHINFEQMFSFKKKVLLSNHRYALPWCNANWTLKNWIVRSFTCEAKEGPIFTLMRCMPFQCSIPCCVGYGRTTSVSWPS
jgi:hypothetical protein